MDGPGFHAWTRRRVSITAGGTLAARVAGFALPAANAKKNRRKKKRCKGSLAPCADGGKRRCCGTLRCGRTVGSEGTLCCKSEDAPCRFNSALQIDECCDGLFCRFTEGPAGECVLTTSGRNLKANFGSVDPADMLIRVRDLPISTWSYTSDDPAVRHIGPMAQDFAAVFGVGADDRHIHPLDGQGVALAAIQGLTNLLTELNDENARLAARITTLERAGNQVDPTGGTAHGRHTV